VFVEAIELESKERLTGSLVPKPVPFTFTKAEGGPEVMLSLIVGPAALTAIVGLTTMIDTATIKQTRSTVHMRTKNMWVKYLSIFHSRQSSDLIEKDLKTADQL
jgi:hypothetical protein